MSFMRHGILGLICAAPLLAALGAWAQAPDGQAASGAPPSVSGRTITAVRSWTSPTGTRVVVDFSAPVAHVAPDSGLSRTVLVTIPEPITRTEGVPEVLRVSDGLVDSVLTLAGAEGVRFILWFRDSTRFRVYSLPAQDEHPYRLVVDAVKPGAALAEVRRLEDIASQKKRERVRIVAVDAGHGGEDPGARGPRSMRVIEKSVTLAIARALVDELNKIPGVRGVLTRNGDYFIPLRDRYHLAEKMKADVFVSIHANSSRRRGAGSGTEVYFLSLRGASDQADADLADVENAADLVGGVPPRTESDLVNILYDVKRSSALQQSQLLAETVLDHVAGDRRLESRGVKQAGFVVLKSVEFPSVLVETAFINNVKEARLLKSREFQLGIARQIATGVRAYFKRAGIGVVGEGEEARSRVGG